jgi:hypothetical protein
MFGESSGKSVLSVTGRSQNVKVWLQGQRFDWLTDNYGFGILILKIAVGMEI